ncbi:MAG TPA: sodium:solute symporter [Candidatus Sumerlaeota bacterium]|nr:sodium:solute symporter [Candidatus Sumerlaeota bacterium]
MELRISHLDLVIIIAYLAGIVLVGCVAGWRQRRGMKVDSQGYFLAGNSLTWPIIGMALFSTNISTAHIVSMAQEGYTNGMAWGNFEWMASFTLIILALFFAPFYIRSRVPTLPDFLERRYNRHCRDILAVISIISAVFIHIGVTLYSGAVLLKGLFGLDIMFSIIVISVLTGLYTIIGGLLAVVLTESIQTVILLVGAVCVTAAGLWRVGGWEGLTSHVTAVDMTVIRGGDDPSGMAWWGVFLGYPVIGIWYWCADQTIVQRVLGARDENHARSGALFAGFIKILPVFLFVFPGLICKALVSQGEFGPGPEDPAETFPYLVNHLLPVGLTGIVAAGLLAALMSTVSGALNSIALLVSYDIVRRWRPQTSEPALVTIGRVVTFVAMVCAILWSPLLGTKFNTLAQAAATMICCIAPPITTIFLWGVFWRKASAIAAGCTMWIGGLLGLIVFLMLFFEVEWWPIGFMMGAFYLFVVCSILLVVLSLIFPQAHTTESKSLVWSSFWEPLRSPGWPGLANYRVVAGILCVVMVGLYIYFS